MHGVVSTLEHVFESVQSDDERDALLNELLESTERTMVFCKTSKRAASVAERLALDGVAAAPYTKDVDPDRRLATLDLFCLLYTSPSPRDGLLSRMPSSA